MAFLSSNHFLRVEVEKMSSFRVGMVAGIMLWFSTKDIFAPQRTSGKVWRFFFFLWEIFLTVRTTGVYVWEVGVIRGVL